MKSVSAKEHGYSRKEVCRLLGIRPRQLKSWEEQGLVRAANHYDFSDLIALRTLVSLKTAGISPRTIRTSLTALRERIREVDDPLKELKVFTDGKRIGVQIAGRRMEPVTGQLLLDFESDYLKKLLSFNKTDPEKDAAKRRHEEAELWFTRGLELEQTGAPIEQAIEAYRNAIAVEPASGGALLNLGTIFFKKRKFKEAEKFYIAAVEADPNYALAQFNLGNLYDERGDWQAAQTHYEAALALEPTYADAHYNLALVFRNLGQPMKAAKHWQMYIQLDPQSQWAGYARRELETLRQTAIVARSGGE